MDFGAPQAIFLGSLISLASGVISGLIVRGIDLPRKRNRIRKTILSEISEMQKLMDRNAFETTIEKVRSRDWKNFPRVVDPSLPQEPAFRLFESNIEIFSTREIELIFEFFRRLKASRVFCIALFDTSEMGEDQVSALCAAATNEWSRTVSSGLQITREVKID
ncbi:MAG: hypothetical protein ACOH2H_17935 [Cypionkella sp.]